MNVKGWSLDVLKVDEFEGLKVNWIMIIDVIRTCWKWSFDIEKVDVWQWWISNLFDVYGWWLLNNDQYGGIVVLSLMEQWLLAFGRSFMEVFWIYIEIIELTVRWWDWCKLWFEC